MSAREHVQPVAGGAAQEAQRWLRAAVDEHARPIDAWTASADRHAETTQHVEATPSAVQGVRPEVDVEAVAPAASCPPAEGRAALDDGHRQPSAGQRGGGRQSRQPATDDDRALFHTSKTIDSAEL